MKTTIFLIAMAVMFGLIFGGIVFVTGKYSEEKSNSLANAKSIEIVAYCDERDCYIFRNEEFSKVEQDEIEIYWDDSFVVDKFELYYRFI